MSGKLAVNETLNLQRTADYLEIMSGRRGTVIYDGTASYTGLTYQSISIREDATAFTSLVCTDGTTTYGASHFYVGTGAACLRGDLLVAPEGFTFRSFQLSAGSIQCT
jgi:hypothetical protein